jgi:membrane-associated protease RseP (regulator of RpoE activity)
MPDLPQDSSGSPLPSKAPSVESSSRSWVINLAMFVATVISVFYTYTSNAADFDKVSFFSKQPLIEGAQFCAALLSILLVHEFGHYIAARIHRVPASLPFFIPLPILSPFGTMGAVIRMKGAITSRRALLDIGASGPLAGLALAIPLYIWGIQHSTRFVPIEPDGTSLGAGILLRVLDHYFAPRPPEGQDILISPVGFGAWAGFLVTMLNLIPIAQLDGGHVMYAVLGKRHNRIAQIIHRAMLLFFFFSVIAYTVVDLKNGLGLARLGRHVMQSMSWLVWYQLLAVLGTVTAVKRDDTIRPSVVVRILGTIGLVVLASLARANPGKILVLVAFFGGLGVLVAMDFKWGLLRPNQVLEHPPTGNEPLGIGRTIVAIIAMIFFVLLFMPSPLSL